jgi:hypothetical protein
MSTGSPYGIILSPGSWIVYSRGSVELFPYLFNFNQYYEVEGLARSNNDLESHFRDTQPRLLRTTGQKGGTRRAFPRLGAWALLKSPPSESECLEALRQISAQEWADERQRVDKPRHNYHYVYAEIN